MVNRAELGRRGVAVCILLATFGAFTAASALASAGSTVKVADSYFTTKTLRIGRGTTVTWKWVGSLLHNVKVRHGPATFRSRIQIRGTYRHRFTSRGTYKLYCTLHPDMTMTVIVH